MRLRFGSCQRRWLSAGLLVLLGCWGSHRAAVANTYRVTGLRAVDGDSIRVRFPSGLEVEVRLLSIDCPEKGQRLADEAKRFTAEAVTGAELVLKTGPRERDRYQRLLAFVEVGGDSLNRRLVEQGLAVAYVIPPNTEGTDSLLAAQARAYRLRRGVWAEPPLEEEPRSFRARKWDPDRAARVLRYENHVVIGNARSRVAHWPACGHVDEILEKNRRVLGTVGEALARGYRMERGYR